MKTFDYCIIGGGVVGCSILNKLTRLNKSCVLIERALDVATGETKANTALVHAGFDAKTGTLKAKFNVRGNFLYENLCKELSVPFKRIGAIVVGSDMAKVRELYNRGISNGVKDLEILSNKKLKSMLPNLNENINCGLYAKSAGIVSPYLFTIALAEESVLNGATVELGFDLKAVNFKNGKYVLSDGKNEFCVGQVIICAGSNYNEVAKLFKIETYDMKYRVGEYYLLDSTEIGLCNYTIFPLPSAKSKGVVITPTIDGNILIGPNAFDTDEDIALTSKSGLAEVKQNANMILNNIPFNKNIRNFAGVRTVIGDDFVIKNSEFKPNITIVAGICSPGLTSAPAIAEYVANDLLKINEKEKQMKKRVPIVSTRGKTNAQINAMIKKDKNYGKIVCRCELVTLAEIISALNSPLKPKSVDAIKRRTRAGMGRCQGGFCLQKVIEEIAKKRNIKIEEVCKENKGSEIIIGEIKKVGDAK